MKRSQTGGKKVLCASDIVKWLIMKCKDSSKDVYDKKVMLIDYKKEMYKKKLFECKRCNFIKKGMIEKV